VGPVSPAGNGRRHRGWNTDLRDSANSRASGHQQVFSSAPDGTTGESSAAGAGSGDGEGGLERFETRLTMPVERSEPKCQTAERSKPRTHHGSESERGCANL
jgi:hypothetical protein